MMSIIYKLKNEKYPDLSDKLLRRDEEIASLKARLTEAKWLIHKAFNTDDSAEAIEWEERAIKWEEEVKG